MHSPATGELVGKVPLASAADVDAVLDQIEAARLEAEARERGRLAAEAAAAARD